MAEQEYLPEFDIEYEFDCGACYEKFGTTDCSGHLADPESGIWYADIGDDLLRIAERES